MRHLTKMGPQNGKALLPDDKELSSSTKKRELKEAREAI